MAWLPLLTLGTSLLSGFLGSNEKSTTKTAQTGTEATTLKAQSEQNQTQSQTQNQTTNQQTNQQSTQQTATDQYGNTISEQLASTIGQSTGQTTGTVNRLDAATQGLLTARVQEALLNSGGGAQALSNRLTQIENMGPDFDPDAFVAGIMSQANANAAFDQESGMSRIRSAAGTSGGANSAAALLENRLRNDTTANLAGVEAQARGQAAQIQADAMGSKTSQIAALSGGLDQSIQGLIGSLMNATQVETQQTQQQQTQQQQTTGSEQTQQGLVTNQTGTTQTGTTGTTQTQTDSTQNTTQQQQQAGGTVSEQNTNSTTKKNTGGGASGLVNAVTGMLTADW